MGHVRLWDVRVMGYVRGMGACEGLWGHVRVMGSCEGYGVM